MPMLLSITLIVPPLRAQLIDSQEFENNETLIYLCGFVICIYYCRLCIFLIHNTFS